MSSDQIRVRRGGVCCFYCGTALTASHNAADQQTTDHLQPRHRGGHSVAANRVDACRKCNLDKGGLTLEEYRVVVAYRRGVLRLAELGKIVKFWGE